MDAIKFYQSLPDMECLQGDTLQEFRIKFDETFSLDGCTMLLILERNGGGIVKQKKCAISDGGFTVQLTSEDTEKLSGVYRMHFRLTGTNGLKYRKISGTLNVIPVAEGG